MPAGNHGMSLGAYVLPAGNYGMSGGIYGVPGVRDDLHGYHLPGDTNGMSNQPTYGMPGGDYGMPG